jgi:hypothetical protein
MKDITPVVRAAKRIETLLEEKFGAQGRGLHEKLSSVERHVPAELHKTIRYIATVRNKVVHEDDYELDDAAGFLRQAERVAQALENIQGKTLAPHLSGKPPAARSSSRTVLLLALIPGVIAVFLFYWAIIYGVVSSARKPENKARTQTASSAPVAEQSQPSATPVPKDKARKQTASNSPSVKQTQRSGKDEGKKPTPPVQAGDVLERFAKGEHVALDSPLLKVENITMAMAKDGFNRSKPRIQLTVKNTSTKTLSRATYEARLFIDSQPQAVVSEGESSLRSGGLFVSFGDEGLKAGESATVTAGLLDADDWLVPDILNARRWQLVIRNSRVTDGLDQSVTVEAPSFKGLPTTTPLYTAAPPSAAPSKAVDPVDFAAALRDGVSAGAGNEALSLQNVSMKIGRDGFKRPRPVITVDVTNISGRTLSNAVIQAQLYLDGQGTPVLETSEGGVGFSDAPDPFYASFGDQGLAAGQTRQVELRPDSFSRIWTSPDVLNAKSHLVLLRVVRTRDGLEKPYGGSAQKLP